MHFTTSLKLRFETNLESVIIKKKWSQGYRGNQNKENFFQICSLVQVLGSIMEKNNEHALHYYLKLQTIGKDKS